MNLIIILQTILFLAPFFILWLLSDTITEYISEGKPFVNNELKSF